MHHAADARMVDFAGWDMPVPVFCDGKKTGETTSGTFSPSLSRAIVFARIDADVDQRCDVEIRSKKFPAIIVDLPFIENGNATF